MTHKNEKWLQDIIWTTLSGEKWNENVNGWAFVRFDAETHGIRMCYSGPKSAENWKKSVHILFRILWYCSLFFLYLVWWNYIRFGQSNIMATVCIHISSENVFAELMMCAEIVCLIQSSPDPHSQIWIIGLICWSQSIHSHILWIIVGALHVIDPIKLKLTLTNKHSWEPVHIHAHACTRI